MHVGHPEALGIADLMAPDYGDAPVVRDGEIPVFWACGVTPQAAIFACAARRSPSRTPGLHVHHRRPGLQVPRVRRVLRASDRALLVEADLGTSMRVHAALAAELEAGGLVGVTRLIPAARTILVPFDPSRVDKVGHSGGTSWTSK